MVSAREDCVGRELLASSPNDVTPTGYVIRHLNQVWRSWFARGNYGKMADHAREKGCPMSWLNNPQRWVPALYGQS